jgi:carboxyl-terminal processing protease
MAGKRRSLYFLLLTVLLFSILGGFYGTRIEAQAASTADGQEITLSKDMDAFSKAYSLAEQNFADKLSPDKAIYKGAIPGMLRTLDPHSNFFDPKDYQMLRDEQKGSYSGVGMQVSSRNGKTVVMAPFPGSPAYKVGLRPGDIIVSVNDKPADGLNTTEVADVLKGPRGTQVKIVVSREGEADYMSFTMIREDITRPTIPPAF